MSITDQVVLIYTTFPSPDEAADAGRALIEARLAACVNIFPQMTALYEWQGALQEAGEAVMLIKTRAGLQERVMEMVKRLHPYDTPALLVLGVTGGSTAFLNWIVAQSDAAAGG